MRQRREAFSKAKYPYMNYCLLVECLRDAISYHDMHLSCSIQSDIFNLFLKDCVFCVSQNLLFVLLMTSPVEEEVLHNLCNPSFNYYAQNNLVKNSTRTKVVYKTLFVSKPTHIVICRYFHKEISYHHII